MKQPSGKDQNLGRAGQMSDQSQNSRSGGDNSQMNRMPGIGKPDLSRANMGQAGQTGRSAGTGRNQLAKNLEWGQTSNHESGVRRNQDKPVHPGNAENRGQGSDPTAND